MKKLTREEKFMRAALKAAKRGLVQGEVPIGAVVVYQDKVVSSGYNRRAKLQLASAHAEMMAIDKACKKFHSWRLPEGCELYVTLEPCPMCMGACLNARVDKVYFGAYEQKGRSLNYELAQANLLNHKTEIFGGVAEKECAAVLTDFFVQMRQKQKEEKKRLQEAENKANEKTEQQAEETDRENS
jgi:tRNA(adenine34) deaminase